MRKLIYLGAIFILAACNHSKGQVVTSADLEAGNLIVYRPSRAGYGAMHTYQVKIGNQPECLLHNGAFFVTNVTGPTKMEVTTSVAMDSTLGTIDKGYVLVGPAKRSTARILGGALGGIGEGFAEANEPNGIYEIKQMEPDVAKAYITKVKMRRDCK